MLLRQSSGLTEALPGLNLVGALLTDYSRFYIFFLLMEHFTVLHTLKNSEEQFIHPNIY